MEKPGRHELVRRDAGLLSPSPLALLACFALAIPAQALSGSLDVSARETIVGGLVTVTVTAYDAPAAETSIDVGSFPDGFVLVQSSKSSDRLVPRDRPLEDAVPSVVFMYEFSARRVGAWPIGPFTVRFGTEGLHFDAFLLSVRSDSGDGSFTLNWKIRGQARARVGEPIILSLMASPAALGGTVDCPAPENALLERQGVPLDGGVSEVSPPGEPGETQVELARYLWTPLSAGEIALPVASVTTGSGSVSVTRNASVTVLLAVANRATDAVDPALASAFEAPEAPAIPDGQDAADGEAIQSLLRLRSEEYRSLFPFRARAQRIAAERELGIENALSVPPAAWKLPSVLGSAVFLIVAFLLSLPAARKRVRAAFALCALICAALLAFFAVSLYIRDSRPAGVVEAGPMLNVPEADSRSLQILPAGVALRALRETGDWIYAESAGGERGWIPVSRFHRYTGHQAISE